MNKKLLMLVISTTLLASCVAGPSDQSSAAATVSSVAVTISSSSVAPSSSSVKSSSSVVVSSSSVAPSSSSAPVSSSSAPKSSSSVAMSSSSAPKSSSSMAASSSSAAPVYEFNRVTGKTIWTNSNCGACHGNDATRDGLNSARTYSWIVDYMNTGARAMPIGGTRCKDQCAKDVASYIVYDIYKKPLPVLAKPSVDLTSVLAINVGSGEEIDVNGNYYAADAHFTGGTIVTTGDAIAGTTDAIHQSARTGSFSYAIPVDNGFYSVELGAVEMYYQNENDRVFSITVENQILSDIDLVKTVGHDALQTFKYTHVEVTDGVLNINIAAGEGILTSISVKNSLE